MNYARYGKNAWVLSLFAVLGIFIFLTSIVGYNIPVIPTTYVYTLAYIFIGFTAGLIGSTIALVPELIDQL